MQSQCRALHRVRTRSILRIDWPVPAVGVLGYRNEIDVRKTRPALEIVCGILAPAVLFMFILVTFYKRFYEHH